MLMTVTNKPAGEQPAKPDGFATRESANGAWEVFDTASGEAIQVAGIPLVRLTSDEARGAIHLLKAEAIKADQPREG